MHSEEFHHFTEQEIVAIQNTLLDWYDQNQRILPWRIPSEQFLKTHNTNEVLENSALHFLSNSNDMETRQQHHAYLVLVSEIMLQQTQYGFFFFFLKLINFSVQ